MARPPKPEGERLVGFSIRVREATLQKALAKAGSRGELVNKVRRGIEAFAGED